MAEPKISLPAAILLAAVLLSVSIIFASLWITRAIHNSTIAGPTILPASALIQGDFEAKPPETSASHQLRHQLELFETTWQEDETAKPTKPNDAADVR